MDRATTRLIFRIGRPSQERQAGAGVLWGFLSSALSGKFTPLLRASFRRQLCCGNTPVLWGFLSSVTLRTHGSDLEFGPGSHLFLPVFDNTRQ